MNASSKLKLVSDDTADMIILVNSTFTSLCVCSLGIVANVLNIIVYVKLGLKETVNISLFGLAVSDLISLITLLWLALCCTPLLTYDAVPFHAVELGLLSGAWPHFLFVRYTGWITAFLTFERFLCITIPLKVRALITPARVKGIIVILFAMVVGSVAPIYHTFRYKWIFHPQLNKSLIRLAFAEDRYFVNAITMALNNVISPLLSFIFVLIFTVALVAKLHSKAKWRARAVGSNSAEKDSKVTSKDNRAARMMTIVATIHLVCFLPNSITFIVVILEPEFSIYGLYSNMFGVAFSFSLILEGINSSVNIFVYYFMSSKYKATLNQMFRKCRPCAVKPKSGQEKLSVE